MSYNITSIIKFFKLCDKDIDPQDLDKTKLVCQKLYITQSKLMKKMKTFAV